MKKIIAICFIVLVFILACIHASATDYYFSNAGSDAAAGTIGAPWQTISKFNSVFASLSPGDNIYFNRGDTFYGGLVISRSGSVGQPITIGAYGSGADPTITGFTTVTAWTNLGSNIWESTSAVATTTQMNMVLIGGVNRAMGRTPNTGYWTYSGASPTGTVNSPSCIAGTTHTLQSSNLNSATTNWTGAEMVSKRFAWVLERSPITGHSGTTLTYTGNSGYCGRNGDGFFIQNDARTLDIANEWYYNPTSKKIRIYSTSSPTGVQVATIDTLVKLQGRSYITFDNISFVGSNKITFQIASANIIIQNCLLAYAGGTAVWGAQNTATSTGFIFRDNTVNHSNVNAVNVREFFIGALIQRNTIKNTGLQPGMVDRQWTSNSNGQAIRMQADDCIAEYNNIDSTGFNGISFFDDNIIIRFNFINNTLLTIADGGAIYSFISVPEKFGAKIYNNIILNVYGNNDGAAYTDLPQGQGIYLDGASNVEIYNNTCAQGRNTGLFLHNNHNNNIHHNTFYNNGRATQWSSDNASDPITTTTSKNNIFFSRTATQDIAWFRSGVGGLAELKNFGTPASIDSNYYARPIDDNLTIKVKENQIFYPNRTLASWVTYSGFDARSNKSPKAITNVNDLRFEYNATNSSVVIPLPYNYIDVRGVSYPGTITLQPYTSAVLIKNQSNSYHFSTSGNDVTGNGTIGAPFQTLTKLNSVFATSAAGDSFLLKRGDTFYGSITVGRSGTAALPMIIAPYGSGADPVVTGFTQMLVWTNIGGGIWETPTTTVLLPYLNMVTVDGVNTGMGRWPDVDAADGGYMKFESFVTTTSITDAQLPASPNWAGGEIVIKASHWLLGRGNITSHSGTTINYTGGDNQPLGNGYGYFVQNHASTLTRFGEWYHNKATERIRMYFGAESPANHIIQAATVDSLVYSTGKSYINISNITFKGANGSIFNLDGSATNFFIDNCKLYFAGIDGVSYCTSDGVNFSGSYTTPRVINSYIQDCNNNGILANATTGIIIRDDTIRNISMIPGMSGEGNGHGWGARINTNGLIEYCRFVNMGYVGAYLAGNNSVIKNNFIDSFCIHKDDAGAIYSGLTGGYVAYTGRMIKNNIILHGIGNLYGTPSIETSVYNIYMDDNLNGVLIEGNSLSGSTNSGLKLHNCRDITVRGNTFYDHDHDAFHVLDDNNHLETQGLRITSNIFALKYPSQFSMSLYDNLDDINSFGTLDSNIYAGLLGNNTSIINGRNNLSVSEYHDLASWRLRYGEDVNGNYSQRNVAPYRDLVLVGSNKIPSPLNNSTFDASGEGWTGNSVYSATAGIMDAGHLVVTPSTTAITEVAIGVGTVTAGTPYVVRFSVKGSSYSNQGSFGVRLQSTPAAGPSAYTPYQYHKIVTTRQEIEMLFVPSIGGSGALRFGVAEGGTNFYLDNIYMYPATATVTNPDDSIRFDYNDTKVNKVVPLTGNWEDVYGTAYSTSVTLAPYTSKVLIFVTAGTTPVVKTDPTITWPQPGPLTYGTALGATELDATADVAGKFLYSPLSGVTLAAGTHTLSSQFTPDNQTLYNTVTTTRSITINKAVATLTYTDLEKTYTGLPLAPDILTSPAGLTVINTLYDGVASTPINAGTKSVSSSLNNSNYTATTITGTFTITKATATITVTSSLNQTADGNPKPASATTNPAGLPLTYRYNGSTTAPSAPGTYELIIDVVHGNYSGSDTFTLTITSSAANIFITDILQTFDGTSKSVTVTSPYSYVVTYNPATHVNAGSYEVIATINDGIHDGADTATFVIQKATPVLTWPIPERIFSGTALSGTQLNATSSVSGTFSYSKPLGTVLSVGTHLIIATFTPTDQANYNSATISVPIKVYGNSLNFYIRNGRTIYVNL